jgi:hypothetical protein
MKRFILLASTTTVMAVLILASALPALAAPPTFSASCFRPMSTALFQSDKPQNYNDIIAFYNNCQNTGGTATRGIELNPGAPTPE